MFIVASAILNYIFLASMKKQNLLKVNWECFSVLEKLETFFERYKVELNLNKERNPLSTRFHRFCTLSFAPLKCVQNVCVQDKLEFMVILRRGWSHFPHSTTHKLTLITWNSTFFLCLLLSPASRATTMGKFSEFTFDILAPWQCVHGWTAANWCNFSIEQEREARAIRQELSHLMNNPYRKDTQHSIRFYSNLFDFLTRTHRAEIIT